MKTSSIIFLVAAMMWFAAGFIQPNPTVAVIDDVVAMLNILAALLTSRSN
jgi:hypothetical protein